MQERKITGLSESSLISSPITAPDCCYLEFHSVTETRSGKTCKRKKGPHFPPSSAPPQADEASKLFWNKNPGPVLPALSEEDCSGETSLSRQS